MANTLEALKKAEQERKRAAESVRSPGPEAAARAMPGVQIQEELHRMQHALCRMNGEPRIRTLLFSATGRREGNSTVLVQFARTLAAEENQTVLLVDANLRYPSLHQSLGLPMEDGLSELLRGSRAIGEVVKWAAWPNIKVITSGSPLANPLAVLMGSNLGDCIRGMKSLAEWVLFDSPPAGLFLDALHLAAQVDGVVMVLEAEKTRWETAQNARKLLGDARILGAVLNKRRFYVPPWLYRRV